MGRQIRKQYLYKSVYGPTRYCEQGGMCDDKSLRTPLTRTEGTTSILTPVTAIPPVGGIDLEDTTTVAPPEITEAPFQPVTESPTEAPTEAPTMTTGPAGAPLGTTGAPPQPVTEAPTEAP